MYNVMDLQATHNRSGEITYVQIGPLSIRATIATYTKASSSSADRDSLELFWGDGSSSFVQRSNGEGEIIPGLDLKVNYYTEEHTYPGRATYTMSFKDPNRVAGILNVNYPNSIDIEFYLETTFTLLNTQFQGNNSSAVLLQPPVDFACIGKPFIHNPNAYDPDGDSLSYELIVPLQAQGSVVPNYLFPNEIAPGPDNGISLDPVTGDFRWDAPKSAGEYNIAIRVKEYRDGNLLTSIVRDMQIFVDICDFNPPKIKAIDEICVVAGERIELDLNITDPDEGDLVIVTATGGVFDLDTNFAVLEVEEGFLSTPIDAKFVWQTRCEHISKYPYQIVVRAQDNSAGNNRGLADLKTIRIRVLGPSPDDLQINSVDDDIFLDWQLPYFCENDDLFQGFLGFSVWRKEGSNPFAIDTCDAGLEGKGYEKIEFLTNENNGTRYTYIDENVDRRKFHCYRVVAEFGLLSSNGNPFNRVQSLPSLEACIHALRDFPVLLNVSVEETDQGNGEVFVRWARPIAEDLDTLANPGPYIYQLLKEESGQGFVEIPDAIFMTDFFASETDTLYFDTGLDTESAEINYKVDFYTNGNSATPYNSSDESASIFLDIQPNDNRNVLAWSNNVSWQNFLFTIYRYNETSMEFDSIGISLSTQYTDYNLINGRSYCYKVKSWGTYGVPDLDGTLINFSQETCGTPIDIMAPCSVPLQVENPCKENADQDLAINILSWPNPLNSCDMSEDAFKYNIYYSESENDPLELIASIENINITEFEHVPTRGKFACYAISVIDSLGNESMLSEIKCVENCPIYELPNTFTPNGDSANDVFEPRRSRFIDRVNFKLYNQWGNLIYETTDPLLQWDGTNASGEEMDEGVYHYTCEVFEKESDGVARQTDLLSGFVQLIRN